MADIEIEAEAAKCLKRLAIILDRVITLLDILIEEQEAK